MSGTSSERKTTSRSTIASPTTTTRYGISAACTLSAMSMFSAVVPVTSKVAPVPRLDAGPLAPDGRDQVLGLLVGRRGGRDGGEERRVTGVVEAAPGRRTRRPPCRRSSSAIARPRPCGSAAPLASTTIGQRPVEARPEGLGERVVGTALGGGGRLGLVPGHAQLQVRHRHRERPEADHTESQHGHRAAQHEPRPAGAAVVRRRSPAMRPLLRGPPGTARRSARSRGAPGPASARSVRRRRPRRAAASPILVSIGMPTTASPASAMTTVRPGEDDRGTGRADRERRPPPAARGPWPAPRGSGRRRTGRSRCRPRGPASSPGCRWSWTGRGVADSARIAAMLTPTPRTAVSSGSPAAASDPKVTSRTTAAIAMPMTSATPPAATALHRAPAGLDRQPGVPGDLGSRVDLAPAAQR